MPKRSRSNGVLDQRKGKKTKKAKGFTSVARSGEMKYIDLTRSSTFTIPASTDWTATEADDATALAVHGVPVVGAGINQRIGKKIKVHKLQIRGTINCPKQADNTATDDGAQIRVILFQDKQTNSTQAQGENLMSTSAATAGAVVNGFQNTDNFGRFRVLKDKTFIMKDPNISYDGTNIEQNGIVTPFKWAVKFKTPVQIQFNSTNGGSVADIVDNSFHLLAATSNTNLAPVIYWSSRLAYKE